METHGLQALAHVRAEPEAVEELAKHSFFACATPAPDGSLLLLKDVVSALDVHIRNRGASSLSESGMKWMSGSTKR
jgi:hypothetical protein